MLRDPRFRDNLVLVAGDSVIIPEFVPVVEVRGEVERPGLVSYVPGQDIDYYIRAAGGYTKDGASGHGWVVQPSGRVESIKRRFLLADTRPDPLPGSRVWVPVRDPADRRDTVALVSAIAQILSSSIAIFLVIKRF